MKKLLALLSMLLLAPLTGCSAPPHDPNALPDLTVTFMDVGAADCIVLRAGDHCALIDTGENGDADDILAYLHTLGVEKLDFLLLTHLDKDHIGGADHILKALPVGTVYAPKYDKGNKQYDQYVSTLKKLGIKPVHPKKPVELTLGGATLRLLPGAQSKYDQSNDYSILCELTYGEHTMLFAGDAEELRLNEYLSGEPLSNVTILKVPHHGRESAASADFFAAVAPQHAVITCDRENMPDDSVIDLLNALDAEVYGTLYGNLTITSNGNTLRFKQ